MSTAPRFLAVAAVATSLLGCGDSRVLVSGSVELTLQQLGQPDGSTGFTFPENTVVEANPSGSCKVTSGRGEVFLERVGGTGDGLRSVRVVIPPVSATGSEPSTVTFVVGTTSISSSACTAMNTVTPSGSLREVSINMDCSGLRAQGDVRAVAARVRLRLANCTTE